MNKLVKVTGSKWPRNKHKGDVFDYEDKKWKVLHLIHEGYELEEVLAAAPTPPPVPEPKPESEPEPKHGHRH